MVVEIKMNNRRTGVVSLYLDDEDYDIILKYNLRLKLIYDKTVKSRVKFYVDVRKCVNGKIYRGLLHRLITNCPKHLQVDHINGNPLDNRKSNLRIVTNKENSNNRNFYKEDIAINKTIESFTSRNKLDKQSGIKNIKWNKKCNKWEVGFKKDKKYHYLGLFEDLNEAILTLKRIKE